MPPGTNFDPETSDLAPTKSGHSPEKMVGIRRHFFKDEWPDFVGERADFSGSKFVPGGTLNAY